MAGRRTNLALFGALAVAFVTGVLAYGLGTGWSRWAVILHGVAGLTIVILAPWKSIVARRGLERPHRSGKIASSFFGVLVVVAIVAGVLHSTGIAVDLGPATTMQVHVGAALLALPLALWHVVARRVRVQHSDLQRRQLLRAAGLLASGGALYVGSEGLMRLASLPGGERRFTGSHEEGSFAPEEMPVTQWLDDSVPSIDPDRWTLRVNGPTDRIFSYEELVDNEDEGRVEAVLDCTGGWWARQSWSGIRLDRIVEVGPDDWSFLVTSATGYRRRFPISDLPHVMLATRVGGHPLSAGHGFPARLVAPGRRGFWWVKWVTKIETSLRPSWFQFPFPPT